jgi:endonuclease YncB( thermonuclease family)
VPRILFLAMLLAAFGAAAPARDSRAPQHPFDAHVTRVIDGDSLLVRPLAGGPELELRLSGIDAPESAQPWGRESTRALAALVLGRQVRVAVTDRDRYRRHVADVWVGGRHVNRAMVAAGHAWAFDRYGPDAAIRAPQANARAQRRGLWGLPPDQQLPPPTWRARMPREAAVP